MYTAELIALAQARLSRLDQIRASAVQVGDAAQLAEIERQAVEINKTLDALRAIPAG
jgi:hypothetical protein